MSIFLFVFRYVAVCHPLKAKLWCNLRNTKIQIFVITTTCIVYSVPRFFYNKVTISPDGTQALLGKTDFAKTFWYSMFYETFLYFTLIYVIPFPLLFAMTYKLVRSLKKIKHKRDQMTQTKSQFRDDRDLTRTLIAVVVIFIICQTPSPIRRAVFNTIPKSQTGCGYFMYYYHPLSTLILMLNSAVNVIIYYYGGKRFRLTFRARVRSLLHLPEKIEPSSTTSTTTTTNSIGNWNTLLASVSNNLAFQSCLPKIYSRSS